METIEDSMTRLTRPLRPFRTALIVGTMLAVIAACEGVKKEAEFPGSRRKGQSAPTYGDNTESIFGEGGLTFGDSDTPQVDPGGGGVGVNSFLWRASLDTISFMPVNSADPFGGVIITDWYSPPETPAERFKMNVYIMGRQLRADGVRVAVFRQAQDSIGGWRDVPITAEAAPRIEDAILTKARQLRFETLQQ